jgi:hypothetical protein
MEAHLWAPLCSRKSIHANLAFHRIFEGVRGLESPRAEDSTPRQPALDARFDRTHPWHIGCTSTSTIMKSARAIRGLFSVAGLSVLAAACVPDGSTGYADPNGPENKATGRLCTAILNLTGTFTPGTPDPDTANMGKCYPVGTWTFAATMGDTNCMTPPSLESQYAFTDTRDTSNPDTEFIDMITYLNSPGNDHVKIKVNAGDGGICTGIIDIFSPDGMAVTTLRPSLNDDNSLSGFGEYDLYDTNQFQ